MEKEIELDDYENLFFDASYIEVDKILYCTEIFPVIHPKKANDIKNKWSEHLSQVVSKLLNFSRDDVHYGVYFMEPVDTEREDCANYRKVITYQMDLGTINNRLYLDYYKNYNQYWHDLGFVFKNCRKYNRDTGCDIRILADTLREYVRILYKKWYDLTVSKCDKLKEDFEAKKLEVETKFKEHRDMLERNITGDFAEKINQIGDSIKKAQQAAREQDLEKLKNYKYNYVNLITQN